MDKNTSSKTDINPYFNALTGLIKDIVVLVDPDKLTINYISYTQPGYDEESVLGTTVLNYVPPAYQDSYSAVLKKVKETKEKAQFELEVLNNLNPDENVWYELNISAVLNDKKEVENILVISKDISASKKMDNELKNKREKLFSIINNTEDIILSIDREHRITECNAAFIKQVEKLGVNSEIIGKDVLNFIDPTKHEKLKEIYKKVFKGEFIRETEKFTISNSNYLFFETSYHPIFDYDRKIIGISIFSKDITEQKINEESLLNALKEKELLLSEIHHRIKNNLALVSSMLQLKEMNIDNDKAKEALADSRKRIKSTALVHELLYRKEKFDKISIKEHIIEVFNNINANPHFSLKFEGQDCVVDLKQALPFGLLIHELIMNSLKHSFKQGVNSQIKITSDIKNGEINLTYCDCNGEFPANIDFNDTTTTGLMLIHTFIEQLNGKIELVNRTPPSYQIKFPTS
ncbi:MAG: PAS domain S-box protein [Sphingobacteriaceae bacterium]|nr:PAS domain S-box protein [Sphingobacteriaceae bacterium]